jgi:basic membrane protein A and related proteins
MNISNRNAISTAITAGIVIVIIVVATGIYAVFFYGGSGGKTSTTATTTSVMTTTTTAPPMYAVVDLAGITGDLGFNDLGVLGAQEAQAQTGVITTYVQLPDTSQATNILMQQAASGKYAVIITIGFEWLDALNATSAQYPNQKFAILDSLPEVARSNILGVYYAANESSALAGVVAASYTKTNKIGIVLGIDTPVLYGFAIGFTYGVNWYVNMTHHSPISVNAYFTGSFTDPAAGQAAANTFISNGADVIWAAAGGTGLGALQAVTSYNQQHPSSQIWAVGVDTDQSFVNPGQTVTSALKHVDTTVVTIVKSVQEGMFQSGVELGNLKNGLVGISDITSLNETLDFGVAGGKFTTAQVNTIYSAQSAFLDSTTYQSVLNNYVNVLKGYITAGTVSIAYPQTRASYDTWAARLGLVTN